MFFYVFWGADFENDILLKISLCQWFGDYLKLYEFTISSLCKTNLMAI